jgi:DNA polymerase-3 subunit gamma/tau
LLKTLEEPPSHVVFVLATTDPQKVPPTIRSRTQHLEFRLLGAETLHDLLESVNTQAGLNLDDGAVEAAVRRGRGSARDALSALDQVVASGSADAARPELAGLVDALADGDVGQVLVALNALMAGGWGPQQLATELIDDLRQVFLAALAPELCAASGPSLERFVALAETMSLARVVRSMEILGHALIDMRDAPDAQVVLEIALVRAVRPDLDSGVEALVERVSALERSLTGAAAFPRPSAPAPAAAAAPETPPVPSAPAVPAPPADVGRRPSLGAVRRSKQAASTPAPPAPASEEATVPAAPVPEADVAEEPAAAHQPAPSGAVDRDSLTEAWGDGILKGLPARAKALFSAGRFVSVDEDGAHFALPNAAHRERCLEMVPTVEQKLTAHFGSPVKIVLEVDESGSAPQAPARPASRQTTGVPDREPEAETLDPADYAEEDPNAGSDQASEAHARLLDAFPGASEVLG